jgi:hypothetical protein
LVTLICNYRERTAEGINEGQKKNSAGICRDVYRAEIAGRMTRHFIYPWGDLGIVLAILGNSRGYEAQVPQLPELQLPQEWPLLPGMA